MNLTQTEIDRLADEYDRKLFPVTQPFFDDPILEATRKFVVDFSTQPYQKSGSKLEALCPAIKPSMNRNSMLLTYGTASTDDFAAMHAELGSEFKTAQIALPHIYFAQHTAFRLGFSRWSS